MVLEPVDISVDGPVADRKSEDDPFQSKEDDQVKRVSIGNTVISSDRDSTQTLTLDEEKKIEEQAEEQLQNEVRKSMEVNKTLLEPVKVRNSTLDKPQLQRQRSNSYTAPALTVRKKDDRLSLQIPGAFDS
jgi:hypothetical protein